MVRLVDRDNLVARIARWDASSIEGDRLEMLMALASLYERERVLVDDRALALHNCCADSGSCWAQDRHRIGGNGHIEGGAEAGENGSIYWPWIGAMYKPGGVCLIGLNLVHEWQWWAPLAEEFVIFAPTGPRHSVSFLGEGRAYWPQLAVVRRATDVGLASQPLVDLAQIELTESGAKVLVVEDLLVDLVVGVDARHDRL